MSRANPSPTKAFQAANRYLGWGDSAGGLWFAGLEEADYWSGEDVHKYEDLPELKPATSERDFASLKANGRRIRQVTARIASWVSTRAQERNERERWRWYHDELLWTPGSGCCQVNLYPLGKRSLASWPADFAHLFGFGPEHRDAYLQEIADKRFPRLRRRWLRDRPLATICFGKAGWADFERVFEVKSVPRVLAGGKVRVHDAEKVVLTHFFTRGMTNKDADVVGRLLRDDWKLSIP